MGYHFEFINGPLDGKRVSGESDQPRDAKFARFLKVAVGDGSVGRWFRGIAPDLLTELELQRLDVSELQSVIFEVAHRSDENERVTVQLRQRK